MSNWLCVGYVREMFSKERDRYVASRRVLN
jgi:hypothetical protein